MPDPGNLSWKIPSASTRCLLNRFKKAAWKIIMKSLSLDSNLNALKIDIKLLRTAAALLTPSVTRILNNSCISGLVPQDWKITRVTPVYKGKGDKRDRSNCRPISVYGSICMIMKERITHTSYLTSLSII